MTREEIVQKYRDYVSPGLVDVLEMANIAIVEGKREGAYIWDVDGTRYLDCMTGAGIHNVGHRNPDVIAALVKALEEKDCGTFFLIQQERAELAEKIAQITPGDLKYTYFNDSGSAANDFAIKLARGYTGRSEIIYADNAYHGMTGFCLSACGRDVYKRDFQPLVPGFTEVAFNDVDAMARAVTDQTAAVILEPVQGEGGVIVPSDDYLPAVREICDKHGALLILDEVQTGWGRTGKMFACQHWDVVPDIITVAKSLGGSIYPVAGTIHREKLYSFVRKNPLVSPSTFGGNPLAATVGLAAIKYMEDHDIPGNAARMGEILLGKLRDVQAKYPEMVTEVRGKGLMVGMEFCNEMIGPIMTYQLSQAGVLVIFSVNNPRVVRIMPSLVLNEEEVRFLADALESATAKAAAAASGAAAGEESTVFPDVETAGKCIGGMFDMIAADENLGRRFADLQMKVRFEFVKPAFCITLDATNAGPDRCNVSVIMGECDLEPDAVLQFDCGFAHTFFQGNANVFDGLMDGRLVVSKGNIDEIEQLVPAMQNAFAMYPALLEKLGCADLIGK
jgi:putrescine aminotransferase